MEYNRESLRLYQHRSVKWVRELFESMLLVDMGLGKTISVLTAISDLLMLDELTQPVLVVGPPRVVKTVWAQEGQKWEQTRHLTFSLVHGDPTQRIKALVRTADVYLISVDNFVWLMQRMGVPPAYMKKKATPYVPDDKLLQMPKPPVEVDPALSGKFGMLVTDESSLFKDPTTLRFKYMRSYTPLVERRVPLTGTPTPNALHEIWTQAFMSDKGRRLGTSYERFKQRFFYPTDREQYNWAPRPGALDYVSNMLSDMALRLDAADWLDLPPVIDNVIRVELPPDARKLYNKMERDMLITLSDARVIEAVNSAVVHGKCHQLANGAIFDKVTEDSWALIHEAKTEAIQEVVDEAGAPLLITYHFRHDLARLKVLFPGMPVMAEAKNVVKLCEQWNEGRFPGMLVHPRSAGHGLNLQFGGNRLAMFSLTPSREAHDQVFERIGPTRQVGLAANVIRYYLVADRTVDDDLMVLINTKGMGQKEFLNYMRAAAKARQDYEELCA